MHPYHSSSTSITSTSILTNLNFNNRSTQPQTLTIHLNNKRIRNLKQVLPMVLNQNAHNKKLDLLANDNNIQEALGLELVADVVVNIKLHNNMIGSLSSFSNFNFAYLSQLYLEYNNISSLHGLQTCNFPVLIRLSLNNNKLTSEACDQVLCNVRAPQLRILTLDSNLIDDLNFMRKLTNFSKLITLPMSGNRIAGCQAGVLGLCDFMTRLSSLQLHLNMIQSLQGLNAKMNNIRKMTLNGNRITSMQPLISCELTELTFLDLEDNNITSTHFLTRLQAPKLIDLKLSKNKLIKMPVQQLRYSCLPFLQQILLKNNQMTGNILEIMVAFADVQEIRNQFYNQIVNAKGQCGEARVTQLLLESYNNVNNVSNGNNDRNRANNKSTAPQTILTSAKQTIKITVPVKPNETGDITIPKNQPKFSLYNDNTMFSMISCWRNKLISTDGRVVYAKLKAHFKKLSFLQF